MNNEVPSTDIIVEARTAMNVLRKEEDESIEEALERELNEEMTVERAKAFMEDASFKVVEVLEDE